LGNFVQRQAELLATRYQVTVLYTVADPEIDAVELSIAERPNLKEIVVYYPKGSNFFSRRREQDKAFEAGLKEITNVDLIHAHVILPKGYLFVRAKKQFNCPLIVTEHASYYRSEKRKKWSLKEKFILNTTKKHIDQLVAVSTFLEKDLKSYFEDAPIAIIPNPIDTQLFTPGEKHESETKQFLHISTLDKAVKDPQGILDALVLLRDKGYTNFQLTIISDEPYEELKALAVEKAIAHLVHFSGPHQPEELVPFYQQSDAFILFSLYETFSIVLAEAWSCGIPCLTTPVGIGFDLPHELGIQVKIADPLSLAIAMEKILNGQTFDADEIRKHALHFSNEHVLKQLTALYDRIHG
jgi:glycosyltransferase involved in cell wall biosynthesis